MTNEAPELKRFPGVTKDKRSANWSFVKKVPDDLKDHPAYQGRVWACRESLRTPDLREANARAAAKTAELEALWQTRRAGRTLRAPSTLTPAEVHAIAQGLRAVVLEDDEQQRQDLPRLVAALRQWWQAKYSQSAPAAHLDASALDLEPQVLRTAPLLPPRYTGVSELHWLAAKEGCKC